MCSRTCSRVSAARAYRRKEGSDRSVGGVTSTQSLEICESVKDLNGIVYRFSPLLTKNHPSASHLAIPLRLAAQWKARASLHTSSMRLENTSTNISRHSGYNSESPATASIAFISGPLNPSRLP